MILELTFLAGRYHATPWGRHVNEAMPEWPPSPFRILRAIVDAWFRKHPQLPEEVVGRVLRAMAAPPRFLLPPARASHTRSYLSQNKEDPTDKKLVFDGFAVVEKSTPVVVGWPGADLDEEALEVARTLVSSLSYLGRSESWIEARIADDRRVAWNCEPVTEDASLDRKEVVNVAGVVLPAELERRGLEVPSKGPSKSRRLGWLEALTWGSAETIANTMNRPPAMEPMFYLRDRDALDAAPPAIRRGGAPSVEVVHYSLEGKVRTPITEAVRVAEQFRRNVMGSLRRVLGDTRLPPALTGRDEHGEPLRGHRHASFLPLDEDKDGYIDALLVVTGTPLSFAEQRALEGVRPLPSKSGHPLIPTPVSYGGLALLRSVTEVVSATPFVPTRHRRQKRDGDERAWVARQVALECGRRGLPDPIAVAFLDRPISNGRTSRWLDFRRARKDDAPRMAYGLRLTFAEPVRAPFSLGYASHFGLGCFVPARP